MSLPIPQHRNSKISIFLFAAFTTYLVFDGKANLFFLIYIFWWDEFLKTIFAVFNRFFRKNQIENPSIYSKMLIERFFMLFVYFVFIVLVFGFMMAFKSHDQENSFMTFQILLFMNWGFNLTLLLIIIREISNIIFRDKEEIITEKHLSFGALLTLHVSIILGILLWTFASGEFKIFPQGLGKHADKFIILPFIIIKLFFDLNSLKSNQNKNYLNN